MPTRYSRPLHDCNFAVDRRWFALPALLTLVLGLVLLSGDEAGAPASRPEAAAELPSLPPAA